MEKKVDEKNYNKYQREYEDKTSWRFREKLRRLEDSNDYQRKLTHKMDMGEFKIPIDDATITLYKIWIDLKSTLTRPHLSHAARVLRCFLEIDTDALQHRSVRNWVCKSYAIKKGVSREQARLDFLNGVEKVCKAARRVLSESRYTAVNDLFEDLLVIKRLEEMNFKFLSDDDIRFIDSYISELYNLNNRRKSYA